MARQIEDIIVKLGLQGFEGLDKIRSSFRDLSKVTQMSDKDITSARDALFDFAKTAGNTEAVNKGLISAFQGLRTQADLCGDAYAELSRNIADLEAVSRGYTAQATAERASLAAQYGAITNNTEALRRQRIALIELQQATRAGSQLFTQLGTDIQRTTARLDEIEGVQRRTNATVNRGLPSSSVKIRRDLQDIRDRISLEQTELERLQTLTAAERRQFSQGTELRGQSGVTRAIAEQERVLATFRQQAGALNLSENVRQRREAVRDANALFMSPEFTGTGSRTAEGLTRSFGELPNSIAGINQGLSELRERLSNVTIGTSEYTNTAVRMAAAQRELRDATQGVAAAFVQQLRAGEIAPSLTNLREVISSVRSEQGLLDTSSTSGARAFQLLELQARSLERQLSALQATQASLAATPASGFAAFSQSITPQAGDRAIQGAVRRNRARQERERQRLEREAAQFFSEQPTLPLLLPAAGQTSAPGTGLNISGGANVRAGAMTTAGGQRRSVTDVGGNVPVMGVRPGSGVQRFFGSADIGAAALYPGAEPLIGPRATSEQESRNRTQRLTEAAQAYDTLGRSAERARRPLREIYKDVTSATSASNGSLSSLRRQAELWGELRNAVNPLAPEYKRAGAELDRLNGRIERLDRSRQKLSGMQLAQGVGAALSGGIFGGPEGLIGGLGGLAVGGVGGAFAGAAFGAQVGMFRQQLAGVTDYSAGIDKLQIALRGIVGSQAAYTQALAAAASVTRDLNIPQETAIQGMTRLSAAVQGAGGTVSDSAFAFRAVSEAVKATGGNAEQADGALLALTQVFSKGKVSAEELNQIAERLPGTFTLFAKAAGKSGPELQKALQQGEVGLNDLMKFLQLISSEYGQTALKIAASSQEAGARLSVAMKNMQLEVGRALQPIGASLQSAFADFITKITPAVVTALKGIAAAFEFLIENKTASGLATFALQLGAVTFGVIALKAAISGLASIRVLQLLTGTASAVKITGDAAAASALSVRGLSAALAAVPGFGWVAAGAAALGLLGAALYNNNKEFKTWVDSFLYIIKSDFEYAWKIAVDIVQTNVKVITDTWEAAKNILTNTADALVTTFDSTFNGIFSGILKRWQSLPEPLRKAMAQGGANVAGTLLAPGNPVIGRLIGTGIRATQERPPVALADTGRYVPGNAQQRIPGQQSTFPGGSKEAAEKLSTSYLQAFEQREEAIAQARIQREEQIADIRKQALEQARQLERQFADERRALERDIAKSKRGTADIEEDIARQRRLLAGEDPRIIEAEQNLADIYREARDRDIQIKEAYADREFNRARTLSDFQKKTADDINKANESYAKTIGNIQRQYAINVAKIIDEGSGNAGKRLETAGKIAALYLQRSAFNAQLISSTGFAVAEPGSSGPGTLPANIFTGPGVAEPNRRLAERVQAIDTQIQELQGLLQKAAPAFSRAPTLPKSTASSYRVGDTIGANAQRIPVVPATKGAPAASSGARDAAQATSQAQTELDLLKRRNQALDPINQQVRRLQEQNDLFQAQRRYIEDGVTPALAEQYAQIDQTGQLLTSQFAEFKDDIQASVQSAKDLAAAYEQVQRAARFTQDARIGLGLREGAEQYVQSIGTMREATAQLAQTGIKGVEDAIFSLVTTGTANFREFAASILRDTSRMIIQQLILRSVMQIIGAIGGGPSAIVPGKAFDPKTIPGMAFAKGGAFAANGIVPFAMGGIVNKPTLFKFADGGAGRLGLMGEAGPEAIMPLRRLPSGRLGVESAGGGTPITVNVSVDASGSQVQGDSNRGEALGRAVSAAVQAELVRQQRPGGLLAGTRQ